MSEPIIIPVGVSGAESINNIVRNLDELQARLASLGGGRAGSALGNLKKEISSLSTAFSGVAGVGSTSLEELQVYRGKLDNALQSITKTVLDNKRIMAREAAKNQAGSSISQAFGMSVGTIEMETASLVAGLTKQREAVVAAMEVNAAAARVAALDAQIRMRSSLMQGTSATGAVFRSTTGKSAVETDAFMNVLPSEQELARQEQKVKLLHNREEMLRLEESLRLKELALYASDNGSAAMLARMGAHYSEEARLALVKEQILTTRSRLLSHMEAQYTAEKAFYASDNGSAAMLAGMRAQYTEEARLALVKEQILTTKQRLLLAEKAQEAERKAFTASSAGSAMVLAGMREDYLARGAVSRYSSTSGVAAAATETKAVGTAAATASPNLQMFNGHLKDAHSLARGVASGFNAMWLTWGNIVPLLAGAALSNTFMSALKDGAKVAEGLSTISALAGASNEEVYRLNEEILRMGVTTQFGPLQTVEALKVLSLAGLDATKSLAALRPTLDFAIAGEMPIAKAAESLVAISSAFGYGAEGISVVGDIIAKTAAISMASTQGMTESFRAASVVAQQYGVSLNDAALNLAFLSQVGIKGSAAGTALKNMYTELMSGSRKTQNALKALGVEAIDSLTGAARPFVEIIGQMDLALQKYDAKAQQRLLADSANNRGSKAVSAALQAYRTELEKLDPVTTARIKQLELEGKAEDAKAEKLKRSVTIYEDLQRKLKDAPGFAALASAEKGLTPESQFNSVKAALQTDMVKAFQASESAITVLIAKLKELVTSEGFVSGISNMVGAVTSFVSALAGMSSAVFKIIEVFVLWKLAALSFAAVSAIIVGANALAIASTNTLTLVSGENSAVNGLRALSYGVLGAATGSLVVANNSLAASELNVAGATTVAANASRAAMLSPLGLIIAGLAAVVTVAAGAWLLFADHTDKAKDAEGRIVETVESAKIKTDAYNKSLDESIQGYKDRAKAASENITVTELLAKADNKAAVQRVINAAAEEEAIARIGVIYAKSRAEMFDGIPILGEDAKIGLLNAMDTLEETTARGKDAVYELLNKQATLRQLAEADHARLEKAAAANRNRPIGTEEYGKKVPKEVMSEYDKLIDKLTNGVAKAAAEAEAAQLGYNKAQTEFATLMKTPVWEELTASQRTAVKVLYEAKIKEEQLETSVKAAGKTYEEVSKTIQKYYADLGKGNETLEVSNQKLREEIELIGLTEEAKARLILARMGSAISAEEEGRSLLNLQNSSESEIAAVEHRIALMKEQRALTAKGNKLRSDVSDGEKIKKQAEEADVAWAKTSDSIRDNLTSAFMDAIEGTKSAWVSLRDSVVGMFKNMVLRPVIQGVMAPVAGAVSGVASAALGTASGLNSVTQAASLASAAASLDSAVMLLGSPVGIAIGVALALDSLGAFGSKFISAEDSGRARVDYSSAGIGGKAYSTTGTDGQIAASSTAVEALAKSYFKTAAQLGIKAMEATFEVGSNTGKEGAEPQTVLGVNIGKLSYSSGEVASGDAAGLQLAASRALITALQASEMPAYLSKVFDGLTAGSATQAQIDTALQFAGALKTTREALLETREPLRIVKDNVAKAFASLGTSAETFKTDFVAAIDEGISADNLAEWQALGTSLDQLAAAAKEVANTNQGWEDKLASLRATTDAERLKLEREVQLRNVTDETTRSLMKQVFAQEDLNTVAAAAAATAKTNLGFKDQLASLKAVDDADRRKLELNIALRDVTDETTRSLIRQVYAQQDLGTATANAISTYNSIMESAKQITTTVEAVKTSVADTIFGMQYGLEDNAGKYKMLDVQGANLNKDMRASSDIYVIAELAQKLIALNTQAFNLLDPEQQKAQLVPFEDKLNEISDFVTQKGADPVALAKQQAADTAKTIADAVQKAIAEAMKDPTSTLYKAAQAVQAAANTPAQANISVTVTAPAGSEVSVA